MRRVAGAVLSLALVFAWSLPVGAGTGEGTAEAEVQLPALPGGASASGGPGGGPDAPSGGGGSGGGTPTPNGSASEGPPLTPDQLALQQAQCGEVAAAVAAGAGGALCGATPAPAPAPGRPQPPAVSAATVAQQARQRVPIRVPQPHTSPSEDRFQVVAIQTWFWMDPSEWRPVTARAELPGVWAEVTATPTRTVWTPGDGSAAVTCAGPGEPYSRGAVTDCGHRFDRAGNFTVLVAVTYEVTWRASTGESGTQAPIVLTTNLPIEVQERQPVTN